MFSCCLGHNSKVLYGSQNQVLKKPAEKSTEEKIKLVEKPFYVGKTHKPVLCGVQ